MTTLRLSIEELQRNDRQWQAFETNGHCVVLAPPGSGKTKLLTTRMAFDLVNRIPKPHGAACITLTNPAASELRQRVELLGVPPRSTLFVGTVHSFALRRVILPFAQLVGRPEVIDYSIASEQDQDRAFEAAIDEVFGGDADIRYVRSTIEFNRCRLADDVEWARAGDEIREVARRYEELLREQNLIDFDDLVALAVEFVEQHRVVRRVLTARYPHLYVDEYQDLAPGLDRLVRALCFDHVANADLFAVGDPDQAVFGWTGTKPELLAELSMQSGVTTIHLEHNYRCADNIIRVANKMRKGAVPMTGRRDGGHVSATRCSGGFADQCQRAVNAAKAAVQRGVPLHEIVVICPTNGLCRDITAALRAAGVPAFVRSSEYRITEMTALVEACAAWASLGRELSGHRLADILRSWRIALGAHWSRTADVALTKTLLQHTGRVSASASELLDDLTAIGLHRTSESLSRADDALELKKMKAALSTGALRTLSVAGLAERARKTDRVEVTTMTSSKGLEFDVVLILGADQKRIPFFASLNNASLLAEDRRKFYVSITRARDEVRIFYSGFVEWNGGRRDQSGPSMFLSEVGLV